MLNFIVTIKTFLEKIMSPKSGACQLSKPEASMNKAWDNKKNNHIKDFIFPFQKTSSDILEVGKL